MKEIEVSFWRKVFSIIFLQFMGFYLSYVVFNSALVEGKDIYGFVLSLWFVGLCSVAFFGERFVISRGNKEGYISSLIFHKYIIIRSLSAIIPIIGPWFYLKEVFCSKLKMFYLQKRAEELYSEVISHTRMARSNTFVISLERYMEAAKDAEIDSVLISSNVDSALYLAIDGLNREIHDQDVLSTSSFIVRRCLERESDSFPEIRDDMLARSDKVWDEARRSHIFLTSEKKLLEDLRGVI